MQKLIGLLVAFSLCAIPLMAQADWDDSYPYTKWVQHPDVNGWDVYTSPCQPLADDFECTSEDPITGIHFWCSWENDDVGTITGIGLAIHTNDPGPPSKPVDPPIWQRDISAADFEVELWGSGDQGWYVPDTGDFNKHDHNGIYLVNISLDEEDWFWQEGTEQNPVTYWLEIRPGIENPGSTALGWKTTIDPWEDTAIWWNEEFGWWQVLSDPQTAGGLDLAFAITTVPEPSVFILAGFGLLALLRRRK